MDNNYKPDNHNQNNYNPNNFNPNNFNQNNYNQSNFNQGGLAPGGMNQGASASGGFQQTMPISSVNSFMTKVFGWMFLGLMVTAVFAVGFVTLAKYSPVIHDLFFSGFFWLGLVIAEFALVISLTARLNTMSAGSAKTMFLAYAALNGLTMSSIFIAYELSAIGLAFVMTAIFFGIMCLYGMTTKTDLTGTGKILMAGLITIIIAMFINMFMRSGPLDYLICIAGVAIFTGLTAHDSQKIKTQFYKFASQSGPEMAAKVSIVGALTLYLDFINIFLFLVRIFGKKR